MARGGFSGGRKLKVSVFEWAGSASRREEREIDFPSPINSFMEDFKREVKKNLFPPSPPLLNYTVHFKLFAEGN